MDFKIYFSYIVKNINSIVKLIKEVFMTKVIMTAKEKIERAKEEIKKAQEKIKKLEEKRKMEIVNILFKIKPDISDYDNNTLGKVFTEVINKLNK